MSFKYLPKEKAKDFLSELLKTGIEVNAPHKKGEKFFTFEKVTDPSDVVFNYVRTILPPKKYFLPQTESLVEYDLPVTKVETKIDSKPRILFGVHPCDLKGIYLLNKAFSDKNLDANFTEKTKQTIIIGLDCMPDDSCFCTSVGSIIPKNEYFDLFLTDIGNGYLINVSTEKGEELIKDISFIRPATDSEIQARDEFVERKNIMCKNKMDVPLSELPLIFAGVYNSHVWEENGEKCVACGRCNLVCPTCYCFDVTDRMNLKLNKGQRIRQWDSCHIEDFTKVGTGEVFREKKSSRDRHRFYRKFYYLSKYSPSYCVGCGRCGLECLADIEIVETVNRLSKEYDGKSCKA